LGADAGAKEVGIKAEMANDELLISDRKTGERYEYRVTTLAGGKLSVQDDLQAIQQPLFHEKRTLIENGLFNPPCPSRRDAGTDSSAERKAARRCPTSTSTSNKATP
jgi:hypothetical protein